MAEKKNVVSFPTVKRMPMYYRLLQQLKGQGQESVSSAWIAEVLDLEAIVVRKDLASIGIIGKPRIGFDVKESIRIIDSIMNYNNPNDAFLVGVGHLGQALLGYRGFLRQGLNIIAGFDADPKKVGQRIYDKEIFDMKELTHLAKRLNVRAAILCVPEEHAQTMADLLVQAGIRGIWNFTPVKLKVPDNVVVQREDLAEGLAVLTVKLSKILEEEA